MATVRLVVFGLLLLMLLPSPMKAQEDINEIFLILSNVNNVTVLNLRGEVQHVISNTYSTHIDFDPTTGRIFCPNINNAFINKSFLNGSQNTLLQLPPGSDPVGVAVDYILQLVFYIDYSNHRIGVMDTDGGSHRIIRNQNLTNPWDLAVDVMHEFLYYSEYISPGNIGRMDYNGSSFEILHSNLRNPFGLALDVRGGRMYWSTEGDGKIESARLDGTHRILVWQSGLHPLSVAFFDGVLYFTIGSNSSIFSVNVTGINGTDPHSLPTNVSPDFYDIAVYSKSNAITLEEKLAALGSTEVPSTTVTVETATQTTETTMSTATLSPGATSSTQSPSPGSTVKTEVTRWVTAWLADVEEGGGSR